MDAPEDVWVEMTGGDFGYARLRAECGGTHYLRADLLLSQPAVHINMLRGTIAKPTWDQITHIYAAEYEAAIASARAQALEEAAGIVVHFDHIGDIALPQRWQAAIRALSATPDTTAAVIEAAKAVDAADDELCKHLGISTIHKHGGDLMDALRAAIAAHEARHG